MFIQGELHHLVVIEEAACGVKGAALGCCWELFTAPHPGRKFLQGGSWHQNSAFGVGLRGSVLGPGLELTFLSLLLGNPFVIPETSEEVCLASCRGYF